MPSFDFSFFLLMRIILSIQHLHKKMSLSCLVILFNFISDLCKSNYAMASLEQVACEDLKAFERRLTEVILHTKPAAFRWRLVLAVVSVCVAVGAVYWLGDPATAQVSFLNSLWLHPLFSLSSIFMVVLFFMGVHRRVVQTSIVLSRMREVLFDFSMDCDDTGKLILKPRPASA